MPKTAIPASYYGNKWALPDDTTHNSHELLEGILGGSNEGTYRFTHAEYQELQDVIIEHRDAEQSREIQNTLNEDERDKLREMLDTVYRNKDSDPIFV